MTALKLETFEITESGGSPLQQLRSDILERERNDAYANGFKDGVNVTKDAVNAEQNRLLASIAEMISDTQISRQESGTIALRSLLPLVQAMVTHLSPHLARSEFPQVVAATIAKARQKVDGADLRLRVASDRVDEATAVFSETHPTIEVEADATLSGLQAGVDWADGSDTIDFDGFIADLDDVLRQFELFTEEEDDERTRNAG